jgi:hypothetical protein
LTAVAWTHASDPKGRLRRVDSRIAVHSAAVITALTTSTQPAPRGAGPASSKAALAVGDRLDHGHRSARSINLARKGFRST